MLSGALSQRDPKVVKVEYSGLAWEMDLEGFGGQEGGLKGEESC